MKKSTVIKLYNEFEDKELIINSMPRMINIKGNAEDIFYKLSTSHKDIIDMDLLDDIIGMSVFASKIEDSVQRERLLNNIDDLFENDYITSRWDFNVILENILNIMSKNFEAGFDFYDEEEQRYYLSEIVNEIIKALFKTMYYDNDKLYIHDMNTIFKYLYSVLEDGENTAIENDDINIDIMNRIKIFLDIVFNKDIYGMCEEKYSVILDIASTISDNNDLSKFKRKVLFFRNLDIQEFIENIEDSVNILTDTSINLLKSGKSKSLRFRKQN